MYDKYMKNRYLENKGFTLIEILVVIAIIGILSRVVLAQVYSARQKATNAVIRTDLAQLATQAADIDRLTQGSESGATCAEVFSDPNMLLLVNNAAEKAGKPVIYTYCSKSLSQYKFAFVSPKVGDEDHYLCVDDTSAVSEVDAENIGQIIAEYSCSALGLSQLHPIAITSAIYRGSNSIEVNFNQNISYSGSPILSSSAPFEDDGGVTSFTSNSASILNTSQNNYGFSGAAYICQTGPLGNYPEASYYISFENVYSNDYGFTTSSVGATIDCLPEYQVFYPS